MKVFLCEKNQSLTTFSWCLRNAQRQKNGLPACQGCDLEKIRHTRTLYAVEQLFCEEMMNEYKQIIRHYPPSLAI